MFPAPSVPSRQQGVISILTAFLLIALLTLLALVIDTGRLYLEQRHLQKVADMAALDASARLPRGSCTDHPNLAQQFAEESASSHGFDSTLITHCITVTSEDGLRIVSEDSGGPGVKVTVSKTTPASIVLRGGSLFSDGSDDDLFNGTVNLTATAFAQRNSDSVATFSVGGQLLNLDENRLVGQLLESVGVKVENVRILDHEGLATLKVTPAGLLKDLGIDVGINELSVLTPNDLLNLVDTQIGLLSIDELLDLSLNLVSDSVLKTDLNILKADLLNSGVKEIKLLGEGGLLDLVAGSADSLRPALEGNIGLGELLKASILAGTRGHSVVLDDLDLLGIKTSASITEPPSWATGPIGTTAYSGQVRAYVDIDTDELGLGLGWLLSNILGIRIHIPLTVDVTNARGELTDIQCRGNDSTTDINVTSSLLNVCVGNIAEHNRSSGIESCSAYVQDTEIIKLFNAPILSGHSVISGLETEETLIGMTIGETRSTQPNVTLGDTVENIVAGLLDLLAGLFRPPVRNHGGELVSDIDRDKQIEYLAEHYLETTKDSAGFYNVDNVTALILNGANDDETELLPLTSDWTIPNSIPRSCLLVLCPQSSWKSGTFSEAFKAYSGRPGSLLDLLGISTLSNGYRSCAGLLSSLLNWNGCVEHNLTRLLKNSPDIENSAALNQLVNQIMNSQVVIDKAACSGGLCFLLEPVLSILKPILNGVGNLLNELLTDVLGLNAGSTEVYVDSISCGVPSLVETTQD